MNTTSRKTERPVRGHPAGRAPSHAAHRGRVHLRRALCAVLGKPEPGLTQTAAERVVLPRPIISEPLSELVDDPLLAGTLRGVRRPQSSAALRITPGQTVGPPWPHRQGRTGRPPKLAGPNSCTSLEHLAVEALVRTDTRSGGDDRPGVGAGTRSPTLRRRASWLAVGGHKPRSHGAATVAAPLAAIARETVALLYAASAASSVPTSPPHARLTREPSRSAPLSFHCVLYHPASHVRRQPGKITARPSRRRARASRRWPGSPSRCGGCSAGW